MPNNNPKRKCQRLEANKASKNDMINIRVSSEEKQKMIDLLNRMGKTWLDLARAGYNALESEE